MEIKPENIDWMALSDEDLARIHRIGLRQNRYGRNPGLLKAVLAEHAERRPARVAAAKRRAERQRAEVRAYLDSLPWNQLTGKARDDWMRAEYEMENGAHAAAAETEMEPEGPGGLHFAN